MIFGSSYLEIRVWTISGYQLSVKKSTSLNSSITKTFHFPSDQALLVSDQFAVTFDGHLHELPRSCPLLLAQDVGSEPSFTLLLNPDPHSLLKLWLNNSTVDVRTDGQVRPKRVLSAAPLVPPHRQLFILERFSSQGEGQLHQHGHTHTSKRQRSGGPNQVSHPAGVQSERSVTVM